jgi:hypothetical protein
MRAPLPPALTAWAVAGEVIARGGPMRLNTRDDQPSPGCRRLSPEAAQAALLAHERGLAEAATPLERAWHARAHADLPRRSRGRRRG